MKYSLAQGPPGRKIRSGRRRIEGRRQRAKMTGRNGEKVHRDEGGGVMAPD